MVPLLGLMKVRLTMLIMIEFLNIYKPLEGSIPTRAVSNEENREFVLGLTCTNAIGTLTDFYNPSGPNFKVPGLYLKTKEILKHMHYRLFHHYVLKKVVG